MNQTNETNAMNQTNAFPPPYYPYPIPYEEEEINLLELWDTIWRGKWFVIGLTFLCTIVAIAYALLQTPYYKAEAIIAPVETEKAQGALSGLAAQYGELASLAGINLWRGSNTTETNMAVLRSREFLYAFIKDNKLLPVLFDTLWDKEQKTWIVSDDQKPPTLFSAYKLFTDNILQINHDEKTGLVTLSIIWKDPELSAKWANELVDRINAYIREKTITQSQKSIDYLKAEIKKTSDVSMKEVLYRLIEREIQTVTLTQSREQYAFEVIDRAVVPEKKAGPKRKRIVLLGMMAGGFISILSWFFYASIKKQKNDYQPEV